MSSTKCKKRFRLLVRAALALLGALLLAGCGGRSEAPAVADQITGGASAEEVVTATQKALSLGGVTVGDLDEVYSPAALPGGSGFVSPRAAFNMAREQHNRATSGRLTVTELAKMLQDFGWPFRTGSSPGQQMMQFFGTWVTEAQKDPANPQSFAPLFLYDMAKRQVPSVDLASGTGDPDLMRLTLLELELFSSALDRAFVRSANPKKLSKAATAKDEIVTDPCTKMKETFGLYGGAAMGFNWEQTGGEMLSSALKKAGLDEANVKGIGDAFTAISTATRIWKLVQIYSNAEVSLAIEGGNQAHKPLEGTRLEKKITATAGIANEDWQAYQKRVAALGQGSKIEKVVKDCMQTFGFPTKGFHWQQNSLALHLDIHHETCSQSPHGWLVADQHAF